MLMNSKERFSRIFKHQEADRIPIIDDPWDATIERWQKEGLPKDRSFVDFFDLDRVEKIHLDNSPRLPTKVLEDTAEYRVYTSEWGVTLKQWKTRASTPEFLDFTITDPDTWRRHKERMAPSEERIDWPNLKSRYKTWCRQGAWIQASLWFGFDVTHSWIVGTERILFALIENPEWVKEMFNHLLEVQLQMLDRVWEAGLHFDSIWWPDDMGYKGHQFFSVDMYRNLLKPVHQRAIDWAHQKGIPAHLHSCGDIRPLIPELLDIGLDALNPLEVKAGMDPLQLKAEYGDRLVLHGGINAVLWNDPEAIRAEMERVIATLKENGGDIFSSDHSVPSSVSLNDFRTIVNTAKILGAY
jgi:uroporphyrinogen decarboxylase